MKEKLIQARHATDETLGTVDASSMAERRADEILPELIRVRRRFRSKGEITERQYFLASMKADMVRIFGMRRKLQEAAARESDPRRKAIVARLAGDARTDLKDLASLTGPNLSEERVRQVAEGIAERFSALTETVRESKPS